MADMKKMLAELLARQDESLDLSYESRKAVVDEFREAIAADVVAKRMIGKQSFSSAGARTYTASSLHAFSPS